MSRLSQQFSLCDVLQTPEDLVAFIGWLENAMTNTAMVDYPYVRLFVSVCIPCAAMPSFSVSQPPFASLFAYLCFTFFCSCTRSVQLSHQLPEASPAWPVRAMCAAFTAAGSDLYAGMLGAMQVWYNASGDVKTCFNISDFSEGEVRQR